VYSSLEDLGQKLEAAVEEFDNLSIQRCGSMFWLKPGSAQGTVRSSKQFPESAAQWYPAFFKGLLSAGIYQPPSPYEVGFLSAAHDESHIARLSEALRNNPEPFSST